MCIGSVALWEGKTLVSRIEVDEASDPHEELRPESDSPLVSRLFPAQGVEEQGML